jgi:hypothetical protein
MTNTLAYYENRINRQKTNITLGPRPLKAGLARKNWTRLERSAIEKRSNLAFSSVTERPNKLDHLLLANLCN